MVIVTSYSSSESSSMTIAFISLSSISIAPEELTGAERDERGGATGDARLAMAEDAETED